MGERAEREHLAGHDARFRGNETGGVGKATRDEPLDPAAAERDDPDRPPKQYAKMDKGMIQLLHRSRSTLSQFEGTPVTTPFWDSLDQCLNVSHLQTLTQVIHGTRAAGLLPAIDLLKDIHNYGSSWGIDFYGPSILPIATNGRWGKDVSQSLVRAEHGNTAHDWYRQDSGAGKPGLHIGVDVGAGYNNVHWDPTNPMERVSTGEFRGSPYAAKMPTAEDMIPKGYAIYAPKALLQHEADIGKTDKIPMIGKWLTGKLKSDPVAPGPNTSTEPFFSITIARHELVTHGRNWAKDEYERRGEWVNHASANGAVNRLNSACAAIDLLDIEARPLAQQVRGPENEAQFEELTKRLDDLTKKMFEALAGLVRHLHAEVPNYPAKLSGFDNASDWKMPIFYQFDLVRGLQDERTRRRALP